MIIEKIMSKIVVTVEMDDTLKEVKEIFDHTHFHHILVVENGELFGVLSDRDLLEALSPNIGAIDETSSDVATLHKKVHQIMTRKPVTLQKNSQIYDAIEIFNQHNISCIPIVDDEGKPIGVLSWRDIMKALAAERNKQIKRS